jgi:hypothetical protein
MNMEASDELGEHYARLPLTRGANIAEGNALRMDWEDVVPKKELDCIMGNPPFVGYSNQSREQKADVLSVCAGGGGGPVKNAGKIDSFGKLSCLPTAPLQGGHRAGSVF